MTIYHKHHIIPRHMGGTDDPENLILLTIEEHAEAHRLLYEEHGRWQDYAAWQGLSELTPKAELISLMNKNRQQEKLDAGIHPFQNSEFQRNIQKRRIENGTHHFLGPKINQARLDNGTHHLQGEAWSKTSKIRETKKYNNGTHPFQSEKCKTKMKNMIESGAHPFTKLHTCPHCGKVGKGTMMFRWHFDKCKHYHSGPTN